MITKFKCVVCEKITAGRMPREGGIVGDGSFRYPRRHINKETGKPCEGNIREAVWVEVPVERGWRCLDCGTEYPSGYKRCPRCRSPHAIPVVFSADEDEPEAAAAAGETG